MPARLAGLETIALSSRADRRAIRAAGVEARREKQQQTKADGAARSAAEAAGPAAAARQHGRPRAVRAEDPARGLQRAAAAGSAHRLLVQPLQRRRAQGRDRFLLTEYERDAIRPHVLGKFRDLLGATAKSPAMLFYLDNWMSADPNGRTRMRAAPPRIVRGRSGRPSSCRGSRGQQPQRKNAPKGLNENYGRELMELHTLGVDGGYTQKDVTEVARAFTGWTIRAAAAGRRLPLRAAPARRRREDRPRPRASRPAAAIDDGEQVLDILARASVDGALHRDQAGAPLRQRHAAAGARRSRGRALPRDRRRPARGDADDPDVAGIPVARRRTARR